MHDWEAQDDELLTTWECLNCGMVVCSVDEPPGGTCSEAEVIVVEVVML